VLELLDVEFVAFDVELVVDDLAHVEINLLSEVLDECLKVTRRPRLSVLRLFLLETGSQTCNPSINIFLRGKGRKVREWIFLYIG
jgi:hypothetical protein